MEVDIIMLNKRLISRMTICVSLLIAGAAIPAVAHAHDGDYRGRWVRGDDDRGGHWRHERRDHWGYEDRWERCPPQREVRVYDRYYPQPRVYYAPTPVYPSPINGVTIV